MTPPQRVEPFATLKTRSKYGDMTAALILSENTRNAAKYMSTGILGIQRFKPENVFASIQGGLSDCFGRIVKVDNLDEARAVGADVVVVLDVFVKVAPGGFGDTSIEAAANLSSLDGQAIEEVKARARRSAFRYLKGVGPALEDTAKDAGKQLGEALNASDKVASLYAAKAKGSPASAPRLKAALTSVVDHASYRLREDPRKFALVIGIENYPGIPAADYAERDADAVHEHLLALGYPERNIVLLKGSRAGYASVQKYLDSWLPEKTGPDSQVFVYFSGHGAPDVASGEAYLVPWDGDVKFLKDTAYPLSRLYQKLNALKAKEVIVALDSCFSGAGGRSVLPKGLRPLVNKIDTGNAQLGRVVVLSAAAANEVTGTEEAQGHGTFTYYLLKALAQSRGQATVKQLYDSLLPSVEDSARRDNRDQTPQLLPASPGAGADLRL